MEDMARKTGIYFTDYQQREIDQIYEDALKHIQTLSTEDPDYQKSLTKIYKDKDMRLSRILDHQQMNSYRKITA